jgi:hypothetical protein
LIFAFAQFDAPLDRHIGELVHVMFVMTLQVGGVVKLVEFSDELFLSLWIQVDVCLMFAPSWQVFVPEPRGEERCVLRWCAGEVDESAFPFGLGER